MYFKEKACMLTYSCHVSYVLKNFIVNIVTKTKLKNCKWGIDMHAQLYMQLQTSGRADDINRYVYISRREVFIIYMHEVSK